jgi:membrane fusion protein (multidrug efflux system)
MPTRRSLSLPLALCLLLLALAAGCDRSTPAKNQAAAAAPPEVGVATLTAQAVPLTTVLAGRTSAHLKAEVRPQVGGIIQARLFTEGSDVTKGQPLYRIDPATFQAAAANARAALAKAVANAEPLALKARRYAELVKTGAVSTQDYDDALAASRQAQAAIEVAQAALKTASIDLDHTTITAPIAGRIGASQVTPGALVTANQATALATIQQIDPIYVDVTQSSRDLLRLRRALADGSLTRAGEAAASVKLLYEDDTPYSLPGALQFADLTVDEATGVYTLRALFPNPNHDLLPGMYVKAVLEEGVAKSAILVPQKAVSRTPRGNPYVMLVAADGTVQQREFTADRAVGENWLATAGLAAGDRVVVDGLQKIRAGMKVTVAAAPAPAQQ